MNPYSEEAEREMLAAEANEHYFETYVPDWRIREDALYPSDFPLEESDGIFGTDEAEQVALWNEYLDSQWDMERGIY